MSVGRAIHLDVSVPDFKAGSGAGDLPAGAGSRQAAPDRGDQERFRQALAGEPAAADDAAGPAAPGQTPLVPGAFPPAAPVDAAQDRRRQALGRQIGEMVERLMVGQGRSGGARVQMDLAPEVLPGVSLAIERIEGRLDVEFTCSQEESRRCLVDALAQVADELALRLRQPVRVVVQTDDEEDRCAVERLSAPPVSEALDQAPPESGAP